MGSPTYPVAVVADKAPLRTKASNYPEPFSALRHGHSKQDEFVYILQGHPTLQPMTVERGSRRACVLGSRRALATATD